MMTNYSIIGEWQVNLSVFRKWLISPLLALITIFGAGCNLSDTGMTSYLEPDQYFASLTLEHHAINLSTVAPYNTLALKVFSAMGDGSTVPGEVEYSVSNSSISVTDGVLKAESPTARAVVRVKQVHGLIVRTDSAVVSVVDGVPDHLSDFRIGLAINDSAKLAAKVLSKMIPLVRKSVSGANLSGVLVSVRSTDSTVATINQSGDNIVVKPKRPGRVVLYTSTYAYGAAFQDSLVFTVGWPISFSVPIYEKFMTGGTVKMLDFGYKDIKIGKGACVTWRTQSVELDTDIIFDDPSHVLAPAGNVCGFSIYDPSTGGNIAPFRGIVWDRPELGDDYTDEEFEEYVNAYMKATFSYYQARVFSAPGVYQFRSTIHGSSGIIHVCDELNDRTCAPDGIGAWY